MELRIMAVPLEVNDWDEVIKLDYAMGMIVNDDHVF